MPKDDYNELLMKNITNDYKKSNVAVVNKIDKKDKELTEKLEIDNRVYRLNCSEAFITIKDHKDNFRNNTKCRLINTAKSEVGKISKKILSRIITSLREKNEI